MANQDSTPDTFGLCSYSRGGKAPRAGLVINGSVHDAAAAFEGASDSARPLTVLDILADWSTSAATIERYVKAAKAGASAGASAGFAMADVQLLAPLLYPGNVFCAGANYRDHVAEMARASGLLPPQDPRAQGIAPWHFVKPSRSCVVGDGASVEQPEGAHKLDWEIELAVVIGKTARHVSVADALNYVAGYCVANDLSARDLSRRPQVDKGSPFHYDWMAHKGFEGACPLGPWITPASAIADPQKLAMKLSVNGVLKQDSNTSEMIYGVAEQIAHLSRGLTLHPGDVILTGTPAGVGAGRNEFLKPGDQLSLSIEGLGTLNTTITEAVAQRSTT